ncbi:MAG: VWA domain-containing protein [Candidatus Thorarchaeota archaeon]|jgi:Ca-activated chloride channel family protein
MKGKIATILVLVFMLSLMAISPLLYAPTQSSSALVKDSAGNTPPTMLECMMEPNKITVSGNVIDNYADLSYELIFDNSESAEAVQVYWFFGLQDGIRLSNVSVVLGDLTYWGRVMAEQTAIEGYQESVEKGKTAVLVTRSSGGYYVSFNVENRTRAVLTVFVEGLLTREMGLYTLGLPIAVEHSFRSEFLLDLNIRSNFAPVAGYSVDGIESFTASDLNNGVKIQYYSQDLHVLPNLGVTYALTRQTGGSQLFTYTNGTEKFFVYLLAPSITEVSERAARQYVFVIDKSGSMSGSKMSQAKTAFNAMIADLGDNDLFNIIAFDSVVTELWVEPHSATTTNVEVAQSWVNALNAGGSTNFHDASVIGLDTFSEGDNAKAMLLLSDGQPTSGPITHTTGLLTAIGDANALGVSISTAAFGSDADENLMANLAAQNSGFFAFVQTDEEAAGTLIDFYEIFATPVAHEYSIQFEGATEVVSLMPLEDTPFFNGSEVVISGRFGPSLSVETSVYYSGGVETYTNSATSASVDMQHIEYIWAQQKIDQLLESAELQGVTESLRSEITDLALYYGIVVGGYTAILVTAYEVAKDAGEGDQPTEPAATVTTTRGAIPPPPATTTETYAATSPAAPPPAAVDSHLAGVPGILGFLLVAIPLLCIWKLKRENN